MSPLGTLESPPRTEQGLDMSKADADILSRPDVAEIRQAHDAVQADFNAENESGPQDSTEGQSDEGAELGASSQTQKNTKEDIIAEIAQTGDSLLRGLGVVSTTTPVTPSPPAPQPTAPPISVPHTPQSPQAQPPQSRPTGHDDVLDLRLGIVDQTRNGRALADVAADARLGAETNESRERGRLKAIGHSLWKMGTLKGIFRRHYSNKAFAESVKSQDIYKHIDADEQDRKQAKINAVVRALEGNYSESMGEQRRELSKDSQLYKDLTSYLVEVTDTQRQCPTEEEVEGEYQRILAEHPDELYGGGMITSHNFYELVLKARGANVNRESVVHAIENMPIIMAESRLESNENLRRDRTEKILDWVDSQGKKNKLLSAAISIAPETAVTLGITAAATLLGLGRDSLIRNAGRLVFFGVGGATVGAMRARRAARQQIRQHRVERTLGLQYDLNDKNREKLEELRYETKPYSEMVKAIYDTVDQEKITQGGDEALKAALLAIAEVQERRGFFEKGYDVIGFTEGLEREGEISEFENARKYAFNVLSPLVRSLDADTCNRLGIPHGAELKKSIKHFGQEIWQVIQNNIDDVKKLENGYVNSKALGGAAMGGFFATAGTLVVGEAVDIVKSHFSGISAGNLSQSPMVDQYNGVKMNGGYHMVPDRDGLQMGNYDIQDANGNVVVDNLKYDPSTGFDGDSLTKLHGGEFNVTVGHHAAETTTQQVSIGDYINKHPTEFQKLNVQWMDNDTAQFDLNEQGMRLTSNPDGSITLGQVMTEYGSSHGGSGINMTDPSYTAVDMAFKQPDGSFAHHVLNIKQGDQIPDQWKPFFQERGDGTWVFNGGEGSYASLGKLDGDKFYSAAAIPNGTGEVPMVTDTIETSPEHVTTELKGPDHDSGLAVGIVGVPGRRGLSKAKQEYRSYYGGYEAATEEWRQQMITDRTPELRRDPNARISLREGLQWHHDLTRRKDPEYADYIKGLVGTMPNLASLDANTDTVVPILVGANFEHDNIYRTLSLYAEMPDDWKAKTQLVLHVNWIDSKENDPIEKAKIDKTRSEVLRAIRDFPGLNISQFESIWSQEKLDRGEYGDRLIAHAAQQLVDVCMAAAYQGVQDGRIPEDHDILLWKGDADARGMSRFAGPRMTKEFKDHPEADAFSGGVRWGTETYKDLPGLGFVLNFMEVYRIAAQRAHIKGFQSTFGVNGGARMSTFAGIGGIGHYTNQKQSPPDDGWGDRMFAARNPNLNGTASVYGASGGRNRANNDYHRHVGGASIDTDASRFEKVYRNNEPITSIWGNVNSNGYQGRTTGLQAGQNNDDVRNRPDEVIDRIEYQMSDLISHWTAEPAQVATALAIMLPGPGDLGGKLAYYPIQDENGKLIRDASGKVKFSLTPQGKKWLISRLQFNSKGQYDPYGDRQARQLYGTTVMRGSAGHRWSIPSKQSLSRMIAGRV